jgi:hypothetical protein
LNVKGKLQWSERRKYGYKKHEEPFNRMFPGFTMYVRDVGLPGALVAQYQPGVIIKERGFTEAFCRVMGMDTTHR